MYFHADLTPLTYEESVALYDELGSDDIQGRADLYLDFVSLARVELLVFRTRLSAVVWMFQWSVERTAAELAAFREARARGAHVVEGWETESEDAAAEEEGTLETAVALHSGSLEMMAVAALETLIDDLLDGPGPRRGLHARFEDWARRAGVPDEERRERRELLTVLSQRRNRFAHALDGSPWAPPAETIDAARVEDTFRRVGEFALWIDGVLERDGSAQNPDAGRSGASGSL